VAPYKLFFLDYRNKILAAEDAQGSADEEVCELASSRLAQSGHSAVEVWCGTRKVTLLKRPGLQGSRFACVGRLINWFRV